MSPTKGPFVADAGAPQEEERAYDVHSPKKAFRYWHPHGGGYPRSEVRILGVNVRAEGEEQRLSHVCPLYSI